MTGFTFEQAGIQGMYRIWPSYTQDDRGYFIKTFERDVFAENGIDMPVHESIDSFSYKGVLRGLHFQTTQPQAKLVHVLQGQVFDVALDLRRESSTFAQWEGVMLDDQQHCMGYIPAGCAHGYLVVSKTALVSYRCCGKYSTQTDTGIIWNDPELTIQWPLHMVDRVVLSARDQKLPTLREYLKLTNSLEKEGEYGSTARS